MSLDQLRKDVNELCTYKVVMVEENNASQYCLTNESPARLTKNGEIWQIAILGSLSEQEILEAESHELGHLLVFYKQPGIVSLDTIGMHYDPLAGLIGRLNNAIPHKLLIEELLNTYHLGSDYHIKLITDSLENIPQMIKEDAELNNQPNLQAIGVYLFDIARTNPDTIEIINQLIKQNHIVESTYSSAVRYLSKIVLGQDMPTQRKCVSNFMKELGYREDKHYFID